MKSVKGFKAKVDLSYEGSMFIPHLFKVRDKWFKQVSNKGKFVAL